jgi:hypothetical protein
MSIECFSPRWDSYIPLGLASLVIYPIGIPAGFFYFLSVEKHHLYTSKKVLYRYAFLYNAYHPQTWWFEMVDMMNKLAMTSVVGFFSLELQMPVALIIIWCFFSTVLVMDPYIRKVDDRLQHLACNILINIIYLGYMLVNIDGDLTDGQEWVLSILLLLMCALVFGLFVYHGWLILHRRKKWKKRKKMLKEALVNVPKMEETKEDSAEGIESKHSGSSPKTLDKLVDTMKKSHPISGECTKCEKDAEVYCLQCSVLYCNDCAEVAHKEIPGHTTVTHMPESTATKERVLEEATLEDAIAEEEQRAPMDKSMELALITGQVQES